MPDTDLKTISALQEATGVQFDWIVMPFGYESAKRGGEYVSEKHLEAFETTRVLFKGPLTIPPGENLYAEVRGRRFTRSPPQIPTRIRSDCDECFR